MYDFYRQVANGERDASLLTREELNHFTATVKTETVNRMKYAVTFCWFVYLVTTRTFMGIVSFVRNNKQLFCRCT
jgi:hypothetical protein